MVEPFRPYVDWRVRQLVDAKAQVSELDRATKQALLSLFNEIIPIGGQHTPLLLAFHSAAASLHLSFREREARLALPEGLPVPPQEDHHEQEGEPMAP